MADLDLSTVRYFEKALDAKNKAKDREKSTTRAATVTRVDMDGTPWIRLPGAETDTPVKYKAVDVSLGDMVNVVIQHGNATITGNVTEPAQSRRQVQLVESTIREETNGKFETLEAKMLTADSALINNLEADTAKIHDLTAQQLTAATGYISDLTSGNITAQQLVADHAAVANLNANYVRVDAANINTETVGQSWIGQLMVQAGMIVSSGSIFELDAIQVNASKIKTGVLDVDQLIISETDQQGNVEKYLVHVDSLGNITHQKLDGNVMGPRTISADKIVSHSITVQEITTNELRGAGGWINLHQGTFAYVNAETGQGIAWDGRYLTIAGSVTVGGSNVLLSRIAEMAQSADQVIQFKITEEYSNDKTTAILTAHIYKGGQDIASNYADSCFSWFRKDESTDPPLVPLPAPYTNGKTVQVARSSVGYGAAIVCHFTEPNDSELLTEDDDILTDMEGTPISARTPSGDYVRVVDLIVETTVFDTDKVMLVGSEDEHLVSIATLKDVFGDGDYIRLSNKPSIEGVTLTGDKTFPELGIFKTDGQGYDVADDYSLTTMDINALWANAQPIG